MHGKKISITERDYTKEPFTEKELEDLIGDRDIQPFINTRNELVRELNWKKNPPERLHFIQQVLKDPNVIKRPILKRGNKMVFGFDENEFLKIKKSPCCY